MIGSILRFIGGFIAVTVLLLTGLSASKGSPSAEVTNKNFLARAYLEKNKDSFAKCSNSIGPGGNIVISDVTLSKLQAGYPLEKLETIEASYKAQINEQCKKPISEYERNYAVLEQTDKDISKAMQSLLDKILKNNPETNDAEIAAYSPHMVRVTSGMLTNLAFTEADVEAYFDAKL